MYKQRLILSTVPFFDTGGVGDNLQRLMSFANNYRYPEGLGFRLIWNVNTVLCFDCFDYAVSKEDRQFFFSFGHVF